MVSRCDTCGSSNVVSIDLQLGDGTAVALIACHRCESRVWTAPEGPVPLSRVLEMATSHRPR